jgi:protein kinase/serine/threonine-protein kinase
MMAPAGELTTGSTFAGRYQIIEELSQGGMGRVYKVFDTDIKEKIALKLLRPEIASDKDMLERFGNELKLARKISHRNVCRMFDLGKWEGTSYITMEFVPGEDLKRFIRKSGRIGAAKAVAIARHICDGLAEAHRLGVIHRDLKPQNIMVDEDGNARIMDFGIARALKGKGMTGAGVMIGTPEYMSPEQVEGKEVDQRSDIYSLGIILYEMVTGRTPFEGDTPLSIAVKHKTDPPPDPGKINPQIPADLSRLILRCLEKDRDRRFPSAEELGGELARIEKTLPGTDHLPAKRKPMTSREITVSLGVKKFLISVAVLVVLALAGVALWRFVLRAKPQEHSSAVRPFRNMRDSRDDEFFSDGVTEDILTQLSKIGDLKVISRTSVMPYKNSPKSLRQIGKELEVAVILEGSVRRERDRVRIVGQLIDARNDKHLWAETFDRQMTDIFSIQSEVAQKIATALKATLSAGEKTRIEKRATDNVEAYAYYVRGREYYYQYTREDNEKAVEFFRKALDLDPNYALAYAGLGDAFVRRRIHDEADGVKPGTARAGQDGDPVDRALEYGRKAVELDPGCAEAYKALGFAQEKKGLAAESMNSYLKAVELNPNYAPAINNIGAAKMDAGQFDEALIWLRKAVRLQPGSARTYALPALQYYNLGFDGQARAWFRKALDFQPDYLFPQFILGYIDLLAGRSGAAEAGIDKILHDRPADADALEEAGDIRLLAGRWNDAGAFYEQLAPITGLANPAGNKLAFALLKQGRKAEADKLLAANLAEFLKDPKIEAKGSPIAYQIAQIHALKNSQKDALAWFEKSARLGYADRWIAVDPIWEGLRSDPKFREITDRIQARIEAMRKRVQDAGLDR